MFSAASVWLVVCQHDNFRMIKRRTTKLGLAIRCIVQKSRPISNLGSKVKVTRDKNEKSAAFFQERSSRARVVSSASSTPVGKPAHAV